MANPYPGKVGAAPPQTRVDEARVIELVDARRQHSIQYNQSIFNRLQRYYDAYRGVWQGRLGQFRNNISIPFTFAMIQSDVARKVQTSFASWPIVAFEGYAPEDVQRAKRNEVLISAQMKDCNSIRHATDFFLQADICGTAVARWGWKNLTRPNKYRKLETIAPGLTVPVMYEEEQVTLFNGPVWETIDRLDIWQQPGKKWIDDMAWIIHRYWLDWDDMIEDANGQYSYFDRSAVIRLRDFPLQGQAHDEWINRKVRFRNEYDYQARQNERFAKPVEIWEMHGLVPPEFAPDGVRHRCIAIGNGRVVLKNREGPMANQQKPFVSYAPMADPYSFDGVGKAEIAYGPQRTADRLNNQRLDAIDLLIDPQYVVSSRANINTQNLFSRAGRIILVDEGGPNNFQPLSPDMRGVQVGGDEISRLFSMMQLGTGETEAIMGIQAGGRETARGFLGRQENALTRLSLETRAAEEGFIEPLANAFRKMDALLLPLPYQVKALGSLATINPNTGLPYQPMEVEIDDQDLAADYRARAVGASQMAGRSVRQQNLLGLLQMMSSNPALMQMVNWANFARQAFDLFDFRNVDELLVQQVPMVNQMAQETGQPPEQIASQISQPMEQLSPETLGQLFNSQAAGGGSY